ncbi:MAG: tetratricopeptide repeat protein [Thermoanaerobaculia bacterium]
MGLFSRTLSRLDELKRALTRDPASRQFLALADEYRRQGQIDEAIETLQRGLEASPNAVAGHVALARLLQQQGRLDEALPSYQAALRLDPQNLVALRHTADLYLSTGDKIEAIKKLKLFRGLNPGDREVNELIRQLDAEIAGTAKPVPRPEPVQPPPPPPLPDVPLQTAPVPAVSVPPPPEPPALPEVPPLPPADEPFDLGTAEAPAISFAESAPFDAEPAAPAVASFGPAPVPDPGALPPEPAAAEPLVPVVTETLAELLRAQGHLGEASEAYRELARTTPDAGRARALLGVAEEISASRGTTVRGRLEAWSEPFHRARAATDSDLVGVVEETVERLGASAAVVTDFEGVPVVSVGPRSEAEAMENLAAELTAFWKNVRRSRAEIGEGALDSLVLTGSTGTAAVKVITPSYALLLKAGPGIPSGRIRFEAARAAEQLRPALL